MENQEKRRKKKSLWLLLIGLLLFLLLAGLYYFLMLRRPVTYTPLAGDLTANVSQSDLTEIIKCQNVVVTPGKTVELFKYAGGGKTRADYRVGAMTEADSGQTQILADGEWIYFWQPGQLTGFKVEGQLPENSIDLSRLDLVDSFQAGPVSGDRLCKVWDDVDPVFELPPEIEFEESADTQARIDQELEKICQTCAPITDLAVQLTCRKNLGCR